MTWVPTTVLAHGVVTAGFLYDPAQDIIYSKLDAWQRRLGYTWAYDVGAAAAGMIIDCEPFYFQYAGKLWMIELWKGQYGLETGAEIGVYRDEIGLNVEPGMRVYACVSAADQLEMAFRLYRNGKELLHRGPESHWWLTGFKWGVFTQRTSDLALDLEIAFPKTEMRDAFKRAVTDKGYRTTQKDAFSLRFTFDSPRTPQPKSRLALEGKAQAANEVLVGGLNDLKRELNLPSNDPNGFTGEAAAKALWNQVPTAIRVQGLYTARTAANILRQRATDVARRVQNEVTAKAEEAKNTYREMERFLGKWRMTE